MEKSLLFIGKFDLNLLNLEQIILNLSVNSTNDKNFVKILKEDVNIGSILPDVIKFPIKGYNSVIWVIIGDVKPTLLLKELISKSNIILLTFNLNDPTTLAFLNEGWGPIFDRIQSSKSNEQKRFLIGTVKNSEINQEILGQIEPTFTHFKCDKYFEYDIKNSDYHFQSDPDKNLVDYLKTQLEEKVENQKMTTKNSISTEPKKDELIENEKVTFKSDKFICYRLSDIHLTAEVIESPNATGDVFIPAFIDYQSKQYTVKCVCDYAFKNSNINSLSFSPDSEVTSIGNFVFENSSINSLFIPSNLNKFEPKWNEGCNKLEKIEVDENNRYFSVDEGFLIYENEDKSMRKILFAPRNLEVQFTIPNKITCIGRSAFREINGLKSFFSLDSSLQMIKTNSFYHCENLESVCFKSNYKLTFDGFCFSQSQKLANVEINCKELLIGQSCFSGCSSLSSVNLNAMSNIVLGSHAFLNCSSLISFIIKASSASIKIGDNCFNGSTNLKSIGFICNSVNLGTDLMKNCSLSLISIHSNQEIRISSKTFGNCKLKNISLITSSKLILEDCCFMLLNGLETVDLSFTQVEIGKNSFSKCPSLKTITIQCEDSIKISDRFLFGCNSLEKLSLASKSQLGICDNFLKGASNVKEIEISGSKLFIGNNCFINCESIKIKSPTINLVENKFYKYRFLKNVIIESEHVTLGQCCFGGCSNIKKVSITGKNVIVSNQCFIECSNLKKLSILEAENLTLGSDVFNECFNLNEIDFEVATNLIVGNECFKGSMVKEANFKGKNVKLRKCCFINRFLSQSEIETVNISGEKVTIYDECFKKCSKLVSLFILAKNSTFYPNSFEECKNLKTVSLKSEDSLEIMNKCFLKAVSLKTFYFDSKEVIIKDNCFDGCTSLKSFTNQNSDIVFLGSSLFANCRCLQEVEIVAATEFRAQNYCFYGLPALKEVKIISKTVKISDYSFSNCLSLVSFSLPSIEAYYYYDTSFYNCSNIKYFIGENTKYFPMQSQQLRRQQINAFIYIP